MIKSNEIVAIKSVGLQCPSAQRAQYTEGASPGLAKWTRHMRALEQEVEALKEVRHPHIVGYITMGHATRGDTIAVEVVTEFMGGGTLCTKLALLGTVDKDVGDVIFPLSLVLFCDGFSNGHFLPTFCVWVLFSSFFPLSFSCFYEKILSLFFSFSLHFAAGACIHASSPYRP